MTHIIIINIAFFLTLFIVIHEKDDDAFGGYLLVGTKALNSRAPPGEGVSLFMINFGRWQHSTGVNSTAVFLRQGFS